MYIWTRSGIPQTPNVPTQQFHGFRRGWFPASGVESINIVIAFPENSTSSCSIISKLSLSFILPEFGWLSS